MTKKEANKLFIIGIFAVVLLFWGSVSRAAEYGGIGGRPALSDPKIPNSDSWFIYALPPDQLKEDAVEIQNNSAEAQDLIVYAADSTPSSDGGFALKQQVEPMTGIGAWITFYPDALPKDVILGPGGIIELCRLQPPAAPPASDLPKLSDDLLQWCQGKKLVDIRVDSMAKTSIPFVIHIPSPVDVGEHSGAVIIQKKATEQQAGQGGTINLTTRVGVRVYETVPGDIIRNLIISRFTATRHPTRPEYTLVLGLRNTGNVSIEHTSTIQIVDTLFHRHDQKIEQTMQALPGKELIINTPWPRPIFGRYRFTVSVSYKDGDQARRLDSAPIVIWIVPWREVIIALAIIILGVLSWLAWRIRNRRRYKGCSWINVYINPGDTLAGIAKTTKVNWEKIARKNKLEAPYQLTPGQTLWLFLPPSLIDYSENQSPLTQPATIVPLKK